MNINKTQNGDKTTLALSGRLNSLTASQLQETLLAEFDNVKNVEIDFTELDFISSAGLRVLILGRETAKAKNRELTIVQVSQEIMEVFQMAGLTSMMNIKASV